MKQMQYPKSKSKHPHLKQQSAPKPNNFSIITNPAIHTIVDDLVKKRCVIDVNHSGPARHICAIFVEKNQSCFKPTDNRNQPREFYPEKNKPRHRHKIRPSKKKLLLQQSYTCRRNGIG